MFPNPSFPPLTQPLSIGNIINIAVQVYRDQFKHYLKLSLIAHIWLLVPVYGWAKFFRIAGQISCLSFYELIHQAENINPPRIKTNRQLFSFLLVGILVVLIPIIFAFGLLFLISFIFGIIYALIPTISSLPLPPPPESNELFANPVSAAIFLPLGILIYLSPLWYYSRLFITDLILGIEKRNNPFKVINQSWKLTQGYRTRLIAIILTGFSITLPILIIIWMIISRLLSLFFYNFLRFYIENSSIRINLLILTLSLITGIVLTPFWQSIKAVTYYDLRCRQDSLDLKLPNQR